MDDVSMHGPDGGHPFGSAGTVQAEWLDVEALSEHALHGLHGDLSAPEQERAARLRFDGDRRAYVAAHGMLRRRLAAALRGRTGEGMSPRDVPIETRADGKPILAGGARPPLAFSLSHTKGVAALAVGGVQDLGIDVERLGAPGLAAELAPRVLGKGEAALVARDGPARFYDLWTLKEAFVKATGEGLRRDLTGVTFDWEGAPILRGSDSMGAPAWSVTHLRLDAQGRGYSLAICAFSGSTPAPVEVAVRRFDP